MWAVNLGAVSSGSSGNGQANTVLTEAVNNNIYVGGAFNGTVDFDPGLGTETRSANTHGDAFILKLTPNGEFLWTSNFGTQCNDIKIKNDALYLTGGATVGIGSIHQLMIVKLDLLGNSIWIRNVQGNTNVIGASLCVDDDDNVITTGIFGGASVDFDPGIEEFHLNSNEGAAFIQKLDANGNFIWAKNFDGTTESILTDPNGNIFTTGYFNGADDFDPGPGVFELSGNAGFLQQLDANGNFVWAGKFGNSGAQVARSIVIDDVNDLYIVGNYSGTQDFNPDESSGAVFSMTSSNPASQDVFIVKLSNTVVMPLDFVSFSATFNGEKGLLGWRTTNEIEVNDFEIQRSDNPTQDFATLGKVSARNLSGIQNYKFIDNAPLPGYNYYRIKQKDLDGNFKYSKIIKLVVTYLQTVKLYPNPATQFFVINALDNLKEIELLDLNGRRLHQWVPSADNKYFVDKITNGQYLVRLVYAGRYEILRLIKLN